MRALKQMGLSKVDVEEVEELARSVARQIRVQMDLRGRFQSVNREMVLSEVKEAGGNAFGENVEVDATVETNQNIDEIKSSEEDVFDEDSSKSGRRPKRGLKFDLSAGLRFGWGGGKLRMHKHSALRPKTDDYHHGGRYGEDGHYDDYPHFNQNYHHDTFDDHYHYEDHYDDHHHHYNDHQHSRHY